MDGESRLDDEQHPEGACGQAACHALSPDLPGLRPVEDGVQAADECHRDHPESRMYELFSCHALPYLSRLLSPKGSKGAPLCTISKDASSRNARLY